MDRRYHTICRACAGLTFVMLLCISVCAEIVIVTPPEGDTNHYYEAPLVTTGSVISCCDRSGMLTASAAPQLAGSYAAQWVRLVDRGATMVACTPLEAAPHTRRFAVRYRTSASEDAETVHVTLSYDAAGLVSSLTLDRPVTHPDGTQLPASQPIAIERIMRMAALARRQQTAAVDDLTVLKSKYSFIYKSPDSADAVALASFAGSAPTAFTDFNQISQFTIRTAPDGQEQPYLHRFTRYDNFVKGGKGDKYSHIFLPVGGPLDAKPIGFFKAALKKERIVFSYRIALNNAKGELITPDAYEMIRGTMSTNKPVKLPAQGFCEISLDGETHAAPEVPAIIKVGKKSLAGKSVKAPKVK